MNILLDTHVLIWSAGNPERLSQKVDLLTDTSNTLMFSLASIWEMQIKLQLGKLTFTGLTQRRFVIATGTQCREAIPGFCDYVAVARNDAAALLLRKSYFNLPLPELIEIQCQTNDLQLLPIEVSHIYAFTNLPDCHRDPFDRILIAQAIVEQIPIVSIDTVFDGYPVQKLW